MTERCEVCGGEIRIGDYPFCKGDPTQHQPPRATILRDEIPGGMWLENLGPEPVKVYSHSERRAIMRANGLREQVRWSGPNDRHVSRWV